MELSSIPSRFAVEKVIGQGNFGIIYRGRDTETSKKIAVKVIKYKSGISELQNEIKILAKLQGGEGIPTLKWSSKGANLYVMNLLGPCINDKFLKANRVISESNFVLLAEQLLQRVEFLHSRGVIHRDIKPHQLLIDRKKNPKLYLIDFGLSKMFQSASGAHVAYSERRSFAGTFNYASLNAHLGIQQSRRDDLESYCYVLAYFINKDLPWRLKLSTQNEASIRKMKISLKPAELFPNNPALGKVFSYVRSLKFDEDPDYGYMSGFLHEFKRGLSDLNNFFCFKIKRSSSFAKKNRKERRMKANTFICLSKGDVQYEDCSITVVDKNFPEMKRKKKNGMADCPTIDSLKMPSEKSCLLF